MKKLFAIAMLAALLLGSLAQAEGIIVLGSPEQEVKTVKLDDFKVGDTANVEGYAEITFVKAEWAHKLQSWNDDMYWNAGGGNWANATYYNSGSSAVYLRLYVDILNLQKEAYDFYGDITNIICTFDEDYKFGGWARQHRVRTDDWYGLIHSVELVHNKAAGFDVATFYRGQYSILVTLPNDVYQRVMKEGKSLRVDFKIGENEVTYNLNPKDITVLN